MILQRLGRALHLKGLYHRVAHHPSDHHDDHDHPVVVVLSNAIHANIAKITSIAQGTFAETGNSAWENPEKVRSATKSVTCLKLLEINTLILLVKNLLTLLVEISFVGGFASPLDPWHRMTTVKLRRRPTMMSCFEKTGARYGRKVACQTTNTIVLLESAWEKSTLFYWNHVEMFSLNSAHPCSYWRIGNGMRFFRSSFPQLYEVGTLQGTGTQNSCNQCLCSELSMVFNGWELSRTSI